MRLCFPSLAGSSWWLQVSSCHRRREVGLSVCMCAHVYGLDTSGHISAFDLFDVHIRDVTTRLPVATTSRNTSSRGRNSGTRFHSSRTSRLSWPPPSHPCQCNDMQWCHGASPTTTSAVGGLLSATVTLHQRTVEVSEAVPVQSCSS